MGAYTHTHTHTSYSLLQHPNFPSSLMEITQSSIPNQANIFWRHTDSRLSPMLNYISGKSQGAKPPGKFQFLVRVNVVFSTCFIYFFIYLFISIFFPPSSSESWDDEYCAAHHQTRREKPPRSGQWWRGGGRRGGAEREGTVREKNAM